MNIKDQTLAAFALANQDRKKSLLQYVSEGATNADLEAAGYTPAEVAAAFPPTKPVVTSKEFDRDRQAGSNPDTLQEVKPSFLQRVSDSLFTPFSIDGTYYDPKGLPIGAMPDTDRIGGKDELGNLVRVTITGDRYIIPKLIPKDEKKRSLDEKIDIFKGKVAPIYEAVKENPLGVAKDVGLGVAKSMWDTVGAFNKPNPTIGDAMDVAGLVSLPSAPGLLTKFDPNVVRVFAGPEAKNFPHLMEAEASVRRKAGEDPQKIWEDTGIQYLPDGRPVFQIDPAGAKIIDLDYFKQRIPVLSARDIANGGNGEFTYNLTDLIRFPEFFDNYPQLKDFRLIFDPNLGNTLGSMNIKNKIVRLGVSYVEDVTEKDLKETLLHELQHGIQAAEGTPGGASSSYFFGRENQWNPTKNKWERTGPYVTGAPDMEPDVQNYRMLEDDLKNSISEYRKEPEKFSSEELNAQYEEILRKRELLGKEQDRLNAWAFRKYQENPGEMEARAAELWSQLTPEERLKTPPLEIYNKAARTRTASYAQLGETAVYGDNYMPTTRFPASQEEALKRLDPNAEITPAQSVDQTVEALGVAPRNPSVDAKPKSQINPLFKPKEVQDDNLVTFYSPLKSAVDEMVIGSEGKSGRDVMAYLNKRAPNVSKSEIQFSRINLDPEKKYSKEEILNSLEYTTEGTVAKFRSKKSGALYGKEQLPKNYLDKQQDYFEVTLEAKDLPGKVHTHYNDKTLAHSRTTVHTDASGEKYFIINELQSDALQNVGKKHVFAVPDPAERVGDLKAALSLDMNADYREPVFDFFTEEGMNSKLNREELVAAYKEKFGINAAGKDIATVHKDALRKAVDGLNEYDIDYFENKVDYILKDFQTYQAELKMSEAGYQSKDVPFESTSAYVKNLLLANIARAKQEGVNKIVIPNIGEIARLRQDDFEGGIEAAKKALRPTYDNAVKKAVNMLNSEYGDSIKLGTRNVDYKDLTQKSRVRSSPSMELDITNFNFDPSTQKVRMAEGGIVGYAEGGTVEDEQMNRLMQEGGMADAGVAQEPVTGNEVPPGALPSEVRDDVPVQLSEGEYVVPADVLRFFGVRFFEDLRNQAKQGMAEMQSNGRIGGASVDSNGVPAQDDDELTPEEEQMLQAAMGSQEAPTGMAEGGVVPFDRSKFTLSDTSGRESRKYIDPTTGVTQMFQFLMGSPVTPIPSNFVPWTQELETAAAAKPTTPTITTPPVAPARSDRESTIAAPTGAAPADGGGINYNNWAEKNYDKITSNPYQFGLDALTDDSGKLASKGLGIAGLATGVLPLAFLGMGVKAANKMQNIAEASAALKLMEAQGLSGSADYTNLQKVIGIATDALPSAQQLLVEKHMAATGNNYVKAIEGMQAKATPAVAPTTPTVAAPRASTSSNTSTASIGYGSGKVDPGLAKAAGLVQKPEAVKPAAPKVTPTKAQVAKYTSNTQTTPTPAPVDRQQRYEPKSTPAKAPTKAGSTRFKDGGLITRPTKK